MYQSTTSERNERPTNYQLPTVYIISIVSFVFLLWFFCSILRTSSLVNRTFI